LTQSHFLTAHYDNGDEDGQHYWFDGLEMTTAFTALSIDLGIMNLSLSATDYPHSILAEWTAESINPPDYSPLQTHPLLEPTYIIHPTVFLGSQIQPIFLRWPNWFSNLQLDEAPGTVAKCIGTAGKVFTVSVFVTFSTNATPKSICGVLKRDTAHDGLIWFLPF
jgi:hypothetical protein